MVSIAIVGGPGGLSRRVINLLLKHDVPAVFFADLGALQRGESLEAWKVLQHEIASGFEVGVTLLQQRDDRISVKNTVNEISLLTSKPIDLFTIPQETGRSGDAQPFLELGLGQIWPSIYLSARGATDEAGTAAFAQILRQRCVIVGVLDSSPDALQSLAFLVEHLETENCRRIQANEALIVPVSIHSFLGDRGSADRALISIANRATSYNMGLRPRCITSSPNAGDFGADPSETHWKMPPAPAAAECAKNPLARGCN